MIPTPDTEPPATPLSPRVFAILLALAGGPAHGYQIMKAVQRQSDGAIRIDAGSLYRTIAQLVDEELLRETDRRPKPESDDSRRRYYELTGRGRERLAAEATRLSSALAVARRLNVIGHARGTR